MVRMNSRMSSSRKGWTVEMKTLPVQKWHSCAMPRALETQLRRAHQVHLRLLEDDVLGSPGSNAAMFCGLVHWQCCDATARVMRPLM